MSEPGPRVVLVTGSSSGFGAACVEAFAAAGDTVIATLRDPARDPGRDPGRDSHRALDDPSVNVEVRTLDVTVPGSIHDCIAGVLADHDRIDVLVNNAGIHLQGAVEDMEAAAFRGVFETNFFGAIGLTRAVLPSMRRQRRGRVIAVSSIGARVGRATDGAYCASKAALEMAMEALRHEVSRFGIHVSVVAPGAYRTGIARHADTPSPAGDSPYLPLLDFRMQKVRESVAAGDDPAEVAALIRAIADDPAPGFRYVAGERAQEMDRLLNELDDAGRQALLERLSGIDWWTSGNQAPPDSPDEESS